MNTEQTVHIAMINSFNVLMGKASVNEILDSGIGVFTHIPNDDIDLDLINIMIDYFEDVEMFEHCAMLTNYIGENFNPDGTPKQKLCECALPTIKEYKKNVKCAKCNKAIR